MPGLISVIIPNYNGADTLKHCLGSIFNSDYSNFEVILVDDCSSDNSLDIIKLYDCKLLKHYKNKGASAARNYGASIAKGEILFFTDSDVIIQNDTLRKIYENFNTKEISALIGSYTVQPGIDGFYSSYKNIAHHYTHQISNEITSVFWTGCGAVLKDVFHKIGGFDETYKSATIEDIQLGYRLYNNNYRIYLDRDLQVTHYKQYTLSGLIRSDVLNRAIPWTKLILKEKIIKNDQDLSFNNILSSILVWASPVTGAVIYYFTHSLVNVLLVLILIFVLFFLLNSKFLVYCYRKKGLIFLLKTIPMHTFFYVYSSVGLGTGIVCHYLSIFTPTGIFNAQNK
jgi:glycosyltransferase involved in cell wall biosynthesis